MRSIGLLIYSLFFVSTFLFVQLHAQGKVDKVAVQMNSTIFRPISPSFFGFSFENSDVLNFIGRYPNLNPSFLQLMKNIKQYTGVAPLFRIGGNSADQSWWNPKGLPKPPGVHFNLDSVDLLSLKKLVDEMDGKLVLSLNFRLQPNRTSWGIDYASAIASTIGWSRILGLEIGNEVDLYHSNGIRDSNFDYSRYKSEWEYYANALLSDPKIDPPLPSRKFFQGATYAGGQSSFDNSFSSYIRDEDDLCYSVSYHRYTQTACYNSKPNLQILLSDSSSEGQVSFQRPWIKTASSVGVGYREGEMNSVSCAGADKVSNVFGASLWAIDIMLQFANASIDGVNFHSVSNLRSLLTVGHSKPCFYNFVTFDDLRTNVPTVRPLYYAFWFLAKTFATRASVASLSVSTTNPMIKVWSVVRPDSIAFVVVHKDMQTTRSAQVSFQLPSRINGALVTPQGRVSRLTAPSVSSEFGIQFAGQTFDQSKDGNPIGKTTTETVTASNARTYWITVSPCSVALLEIDLTFS